MCKELAVMEVSGSDKNSEKQEGSSFNFKKLIISRCQKEFEKNTVNEVARSSKLKEIDECLDSVSQSAKIHNRIYNNSFVFESFLICVSYLVLGKEERFTISTRR